MLKTIRKTALPNFAYIIYVCIFAALKQNRGVEQLVARRAHNPKVAGSSPASAMIPNIIIETTLTPNPLHPTH